MSNFYNLILNLHFFECAFFFAQVTMLMMLQKQF